MKLSEAMFLALKDLPVEMGSYGAPHSNVLKALVRRGLARFDWGGNDDFNGNPPDVRLTEVGVKILREENPAKSG